MICTTNESRSAVTAGAEVRADLAQSLIGLEWLAFFVTGDEGIATACVIHACGLEQSNGTVRAGTMQWARYPTIHAAIQTQQVRIAQLSSRHEHGICQHRLHPALSPDLIELVIEEGDLLVKKLDVLSRCTLVICGIEARPVREAAGLLGITDAVAQAAYCRAIEYLEIIRCQEFIDENEYAAVSN